jgi:transposase
MTLLPPGVKVHLAFAYIDMRKGIDGLAMLVQGVLRQDPFSGHLFVFRGRKANLIKIVFWDGTGLLPVHQAARARRIPLAVERRTWRDADADLSAVVDAD